MGVTTHPYPETVGAALVAAPASLKQVNATGGLVAGHPPVATGEGYNVTVSTDMGRAPTS